VVGILKIISESLNCVEIELPCGRITKISNDSKKYLHIFKSWRFAGGYVKICRYIKTDFGSAKEEYYLHTLLLGRPTGFQIDHINRNKLDNTLENLRLATRGENAMNKAKAKGTVSKYRGVSYKYKNNKKNPWTAYISKNGTRYDLGYFKSEIEAAKAYNKKSLELCGSFAFLNNLKEN